MAPPTTGEPDLEYWRSDSWIDIWAGVPLKVPQPRTAASLVWTALLPSSNVNFPQITEICEQVSEQPAETLDAVRLLVDALRDAYAPYQKKLKSLTISHEMMYDEFSRSKFCAVEGLREALAALQTVKDSGLGSAMDSNIRMLAHEIDKNCFSGEPMPRQNKIRNLVGNLTAGLRRERSDQNMVAQGGANASAAGPTENSFYFDEKFQRWRQKGVPDEFDNQPTPTTASNSSSVGGSQPVPLQSQHAAVSSSEGPGQNPTPVLAQPALEQSQQVSVSAATVAANPAPPQSPFEAPPHIVPPTGSQPATSGAAVEPPQPSPPSATSQIAASPQAVFSVVETAQQMPPSFVAPPATLQSQQPNPNPFETPHQMPPSFVTPHATLPPQQPNSTPFETSHQMPPSFLAPPEPPQSSQTAESFFANSQHTPPPAGSTAAGLQDGPSAIAVNPFSAPSSTAYTPFGAGTDIPAPAPQASMPPDLAASFGFSPGGSLASTVDVAPKPQSDTGIASVSSLFG